MAILDTEMTLASFASTKQPAIWSQHWPQCAKSTERPESRNWRLLDDFSVNIRQIFRERERIFIEFCSTNDAPAIECPEMSQCEKLE